MKEALKGIEVDLMRLRERREATEEDHERRARSLADEYARQYDAIDAQIEALETARKALLSVNGHAEPTDKEVEELLDKLADEPVPDVPERTPSEKTLAAMFTMENQLRKSVEGVTALELGKAAGLKGRGSTGVREAALRHLLERGLVFVANQTSSDGTPLYMVAG